MHHMLLQALVDSNIAYKASAGRLAGRSTIECWASAGTVIELVSDIVDATSFAQTQARLTRLLALVGDRILPDPDTLLVWYLGTPLPSEVVAYWVTLARLGCGVRRGRGDRGGTAGRSRRAASRIR